MISDCENHQKAAARRVAVVIATSGRPEAVVDPIKAVERMRLSLASENISVLGLVSAPQREDVVGVTLPKKWQLLLGTRGLAAQRNRALDELPEDIDYVFFFDDDAIPRDDYIATAIDVFTMEPRVVGITGCPVLDGTLVRREISVTDARAALDNSYASSPRRQSLSIDLSHRELYGCNFAIRWPVLSDLRFDGRLPLYSWLEDEDFACRALKSGLLAKVTGCIIVHRGSSSGGRLSHRRLGYSQVANPVYLWQKGSFSLSTMARELRRVLKNILLALIPSARYQFRRLRLSGNFRALADIIKNHGTAHPEKMLELTES